MREADRIRRLAGAAPHLRGLAPVVLLITAWTAGMGARAAQGQEVSLDTTSLAAGPCGEMCMLLEKTLFQVDVLTLRLRFGPQTTSRLRKLAGGRSFRGPLADSVAAAALDARDAFVRLEFRRNVGLGRFLKETRKNLGRARDAGIVSPDAFRRISDQLPEWYEFLADRGIREGDRILYRIRGDTLRSVYRTREGGVPLDVTDTGRERRLSVLGSYLAPGSDFREGLVRSLFRGEAGACPNGAGAGP